MFYIHVSDRRLWKSVETYGKRMFYAQVISARKGEFETGFDRGGQTNEHALLARTVGVKRMVILVNKMDDPTVEWDESRFLLLLSTRL
jgi:translation elongation factor EF-1alpha